MMMIILVANRSSHRKSNSNLVSLHGRTGPPTIAQTIIAKRCQLPTDDADNNLGN